MKRYVSFMFVLLLSLGYITGCGNRVIQDENELHTEEVLQNNESTQEDDKNDENDLSSTTPTEIIIPENAIPDILSWGGNAVSKHRSTLYEIYITDRDTILKYIELLEKYGFELTETWKSPSDDREEWGFVKTAYPDWKKYGGKWLNNSYHLSIYRFDNSGEFNFVYDDETFEMYDVGERLDGSTATPGPINISPEEIDANNDAAITLNLSVGETSGVSYTWTKFGSAYNTYDWEVTSGSEHIEIESIVGDTCKFKAVSKGTAVLQVKYHYTVEEEDVLTGNIRKKPKVKTKEYKIVVE